MSFRSVWRKGSVLVLGAALVGSAFLGAVSVSAQAPPSLPSLAIITGIKDQSGPVTSGNVSAWVGTTKCIEKPVAVNVALEVGQPNQPDACKATTGKISFQVDGKLAAETLDIKPGVPQPVSLTLGAAAPAPAAGGAAPAPARTGTGGYLGSSDSGMLALALGLVALAAVGGGLAVRRVRR